MKLIPKNEKKIMFIPKAKRQITTRRCMYFIWVFFLVTKSK